VNEDHPLLGTQALPFQLEATTGDIVRLFSYRGRNVVLFFVREFT
jgi:peroxiredoxin